MTMYLRKLTRKYVGPSALGAADGSSPANCFSVTGFSAWAAANPSLAPNSFGLMLDGHYITSNGGYIQPNSSVAGKPGGWVNYKAINDGKVELDGEGVNLTCKIGNIGNDWIRVSGLNAHDSSQNCFEINRAAHCIIERCVGWNGSLTENFYTFQINNDQALNNLIEDCAGFGWGRKHFLSFSNFGPNTFRRCWARWAGSSCVGPKITFSQYYDSFKTLMENGIFTWDQRPFEALYPTGFLLTNSAVGGSVWFRQNTSTTSNTVPSVGSLPTSMTWTMVSANTQTEIAVGNYLRFWSAGDTTTWCDGNITAFDTVLKTITLNVIAVSGSGNTKTDWVETPYYGKGNLALVYTSEGMSWGQDANVHPPYDSSVTNCTSIGILLYQKQPQTFPGPGTSQPFALANHDNITVKDVVSFLDTGYNAQNIILSNGTAHTGLTVTNLTSFNPTKGTNPSSYAADWTKTNVQEYTGLADAAYGGQNIYTADSSHGGKLRYRYMNGVLKDGSDGFHPIPLWPWPMNQRILDATSQASAAQPSLNIAIENLDGWRQSVFGLSPDE
jgi:hypothetical protein